MNGTSIRKTFPGGEDVNIVCDVAASNPAVSSLTLSTSSDVSNVDFDEGTGTITIRRATAANTGTYTCTADNGQTTRTTISFVLTIDDMPTTREPTTARTSTTDSAGQLMPFSSSQSFLYYLFSVFYAGNLLATFSVAVVMLLAAILLS